MHQPPCSPDGGTLAGLWPSPHPAGFLNCISPIGLGVLFPLSLPPWPFMGRVPGAVADLLSGCLWNSGPRGLTHSLLTTGSLPASWYSPPGPPPPAELKGWTRWGEWPFPTYILSLGLSFQRAGEGAAGSQPPGNLISISPFSGSHYQGPGASETCNFPKAFLSFLCLLRSLSRPRTPWRPLLQWTSNGGIESPKPYGGAYDMTLNLSPTLDLRGQDAAFLPK